jgi:hypothetical protein
MARVFSAGRLEAGEGQFVSTLVFLPFALQASPGCRIPKRFIFCLESVAEVGRLHIRVIHKVILAALHHGGPVLQDKP